MPDRTTRLLALLSRPWVLLGLAVLLSTAVAWMAYRYLQQREIAIGQALAATNRQHPTVAVVVPKVDVSPDTPLNPDDFVSRSIEEDLLYPDTVLSSQFDALAGKKLLRPVLRGRPVRLSDLQAPEIDDVAALLPEGKRALTIDIDKLNSISQTLRAGHRVDVFLIASVPKPEGAAQVSLFMQDMQVLAAGRQFADIGDTATHHEPMRRPGEVEGGGEPGFDTVTLLVTPAQAGKLLLGQRMGSYRIALRGSRDRTPVSLQALQTSDFVPTAAPTRRRGIDFIVGGQGGRPVAMPGEPVPDTLAPFAADGSPAAGPNVPTHLENRAR